MTIFLTVFVTVFLAELGDKTQLATVLFASDKGGNRWLVFVAAASALILSTGLAVLLGAMLDRWMAGMPFKLIAGLGFLVIGVWMIADHFNAA